MIRLRKIKAFTLTEMLVVLAITSIVVGLAYTILSLFGRNIQLIQSNYSANTEWSVLEQQITVDMNRFHNVTYDNTTDILKLSTPIDSIQYKLDKTAVIRQQDTIFNVAYAVDLYYLGNKVDRGPIDALKVSLKEDKKETFLFFYKNNSSLQLTANGN